MTNDTLLFKKTQSVWCSVSKKNLVLSCEVDKAYKSLGWQLPSNRAVDDSALCIICLVGSRPRTSEVLVGAWALQPLDIRCIQPLHPKVGPMLGSTAPLCTSSQLFLTLSNVSLQRLSRHVGGTNYTIEHELCLLTYNSGYFQT